MERSAIIEASEESKGIVHPLRKIVDGRKMPTNPEKELLNLSIGNYIRNRIIDFTLSTSFPVSTDPTSAFFVSMHKYSIGA